MIKENKINSFELFTIIVSLCNSAFYGTFSSFIIYNSQNETPLSMLIGLLIALLISKIIFSSFKIYPNLSFSNKIKKVFKHTNILFNIVIIICSFFCYILLTYRLTAFLSNQYLIETPNFLISIMILLITFYISSKKDETLFRVSTISFFLSSLIFVFDFASLIGQINIENFFPIMTVKKSKIIISSLLYAFYFIMPLLNIHAIKYNQIQDKNNISKAYYLGIIISFIITLLNIITTIGVSGVKINNLFDYPIYTTLKRIKLFSFLDSLENVSIMLWILYIINASSIMLLFIFNSIKDTFSLKNTKNKLTNFILLFLSFIIPNLLFNNNGYTESYEYVWFPFAILVLMLLIIIIMLIKNKLIISNHSKRNS